MPSLTQYWYRPSLNGVTRLLLPFSWLFALIVWIRKKLYQVGVMKSQRFSVPVMVVGNIAVGGTGKTPLVIGLAHYLQSQGYQPGIVSRGYGGQSHGKPYAVQPQDEAIKVGDEAILLRRETQCPVIICKDRVAAVRYLLQKTRCNVVISDDGLQHYALARDMEIAVVDGKRRFGNGRLLPAGPLREPLARLRSVNWVMVNEGDSNDAFTMTIEPLQLISLKTGAVIPWADFPRGRIHAVAGIGHPERFFTLLKQAGFDVVAHAFPDHHFYSQQDLDFTEPLPLIMTEKDAVKCKAYADERYWSLAITVKISESFKDNLLQKLKSLEVKDESEADFTKRTCGIIHNEQRARKRSEDNR